MAQSREDLARSREETRQAQAKLEQAQASLAQSREDLARSREETRQAQAALEQSKAETGRRKRENKQLQAENKSLKEVEALTKNLDLVIVMDMTGSLDGELENLKANIRVLIKVLQKTITSLRIGFVAYRDFKENYESEAKFNAISGNYVTKSFPIQEVSDKLITFIHKLSARGGGDVPEAVNEGLKKAIKMKWRIGTNNVKKVIVVIGDVPSHNNTNAYNKVKGFISTHKNAKVSAIISDGSDEGKSFFKKLANDGQGEYVEDEGKILASLLMSIMD